MTAKKKARKVAPRRRTAPKPRLHPFRMPHEVEGEQPDVCAVKGCGRPGADLVHRGGKAH